MAAQAVDTARCLLVRPDGVQEVSRALPREVPVAMVYNGSTHAVMMATPDDLEDFAFGFSLSEHVITGPDEIERLEIVEHGAGIEARIWLAEDRARAMIARRRQIAGPVGCGLCGIDSLEEALHPVSPLPAPGEDRFQLEPATVIAAMAALRCRQPLHDRTRAVHAAGFLRPGAGVTAVREDVGRHNALDKLIGALARERAGNPGGIGGQGPTRAIGSGGAIILTSRVSVEMVQKCAVLGAPVLIAASAPTALALQVAQQANITVAALVRDDEFRVFTLPERIAIGEFQNVT